MSAPAPPPSPEGRRYPSTLGGLCYLVLLVVAAVAVLLSAFDDWRLGVRMLAGVLGAAALLRLVLPQRDAGMLAVRHRAIDVALLLGVALALFLLVGSIAADQPR
ncbi:DUF3017 domain-containing protein [Nocardioides sp.]|uniref:DUF3017 domain-containing protein n=1 Tax=Nocardioides sp. TaxID=35761 RepID=UPI0035139978